MLRPNVAGSEPAAADVGAAAAGDGSIARTRGDVSLPAKRGAFTSSANLADHH